MGRRGHFSLLSHESFLVLLGLKTFQGQLASYRMTLIIPFLLACVLLPCTYYSYVEIRCEEISWLPTNKLTTLLWCWKVATRTRRLAEDGAITWAQYYYENCPAVVF